MIGSDPGKLLMMYCQSTLSSESAILLIFKLFIPPLAIY